MLSVRGTAGHTITVAFEDARSAHSSSEITDMVQSACDHLDDLIEDLVSPTDDNAPSSHIHPDVDVNDDDASSFDDASSVDSPLPVKDSSNIKDEAEPDTTPSHESPDASQAVTAPAAGERIEVFWPSDNAYYPGVVYDITDDGKQVITYDDNDIETLDMSVENWRYESIATSLTGSFVSLPSTEQCVIKELMKAFGDKPFLRYQAQAFEQFPLANAYAAEENEFIKNVRIVKRSTVPRNANVISSHVLYKVKVNDNASLKLKARIAPHGNEDSDKQLLRTDCCMCAPVGIRVVLIVATNRGWRVLRVDVKTAFLQTGPAQRAVYVIPPRKCRRREEVWLLLATVYGLVNSNAKWQVQSDAAVCSLGFVQSCDVHQLFIHHDENGEVDVILIKIVDEILATGRDDALKTFVSSFGEKFTLGDVMSGPGRLRFYGLNVIKNEDFSCSIDGDENLGAIEPFTLWRVRRRQCNDEMNAIEKTAFMSVNASIEWLGITTSLLCAFYASHLQQKPRDGRVYALMSQAAVLNVLKCHGTQSIYEAPPVDVCHDVTLVAFLDASHAETASQICYIVGIVYGPISIGSTFHLLTWASHKSRRPVKSTAAAEILAAGEALDEIVSLRDDLSCILHVTVKLAVQVDSKDLFVSLSSQRHPTVKSVCGDVNSIGYHYETCIDLFGWIRGSCNPADVGAKLKSPLTDSLVLTCATGRLHFDVMSLEVAIKDKSLG